MFVRNRTLLVTVTVTAIQVFTILYIGTAYSEIAAEDDAIQREELLAEVVVTAHHLELAKDKSGVNFQPGYNFCYLSKYYF